MSDDKFATIEKHCTKRVMQQTETLTSILIDVLGKFDDNKSQTFKRKLEKVSLNDNKKKLLISWYKQYRECRKQITIGKEDWMVDAMFSITIGNLEVNYMMVEDLCNRLDNNKDIKKDNNIEQSTRLRNIFVRSCLSIFESIAETEEDDDMVAHCKNGILTCNEKLGIVRKQGRGGSSLDQLLQGMGGTDGIGKTLGSMMNNPQVRQMMDDARENGLDNTIRKITENPQEMMETVKGVMPADIVDKMDDVMKNVPINNETINDSN